ncbi:MAG: UDP-N-acetylmuramoyl-L-alanine--D-glutamate ligase [Desulfuromonadales bacterium]|nr:UDP-N-acetylmuramoyl-L-alanine--D-glutamate ligase [Desulfuromonadales bacterium]MDW7756388.1 UDP-N-acetylmuramoyl-L-alanine--D-glutamate ligase [Desulfuromonadales bacterium]
MKRDFTGKQIVVVGAGRTGVALCAYFSRRGARVTLSDQRSAERIEGLARLPKNTATDFGGHTEALFQEADLIAVSPGVPLTVPAIAKAAASGVPVVGEIEVAYEELEAPLIAITGTNGKSTTTTVMGEVLQAWGKETFVGGNLGTPLIEAVDAGPWQWLVAELSSFQLEAIQHFRPRYALLLNISEDHLDRYADMDAYVQAKARVFANQTDGDVAVLNAEDNAVCALGKNLTARHVYFSSARVLEEGMGCDGTHIVWNWQGKTHRFPLAELRLKGLHNVENVMAALIPPLLEGCPATTAWRAACQFGGLAHRMVPVRTLNGVTWYDDSKGTNVGSVVKSLSGLTAPVTLIAGGKDKGGDYLPLVEVVKDRVSHLILIGQAAERIAESLGSLTHTVRAASLEEAVRLAHELTPEGGTVLLSPGCSSFDMFSSYIERGERFAALVMGLPETKRD